MGVTIMTDYELFTRTHIKYTLQNLRNELQLVDSNTRYEERSNKRNYILGQIDALEYLKKRLNSEFEQVQNSDVEKLNFKKLKNVIIEFMHIYIDKGNELDEKNSDKYLYYNMAHCMNSLYIYLLEHQNELV